MNAKSYYEMFINLEKKGDYYNAWANLMLAMYQKDKTSEEICNEIKKRTWIDARLPYMNLNDREWQMTFAALADDAENRQDGIICLLICRILDRDFRWYSASANIGCMENIMSRYTDWSEYRNAMEVKAKQLGYSLD